MRAVARALVGLAPAWFRVRRGEEVLSQLAARLAEGPGGLAGVWLRLRELAGLAQLVAGLWMGAGARVRRTERRSAGVVDRVILDVRYAVRSLSRNRSYAGAAVVVLGLGLGATTAIFSAVNAYFFRPLPFADEDRLVMLYETNPEFAWTDQTAAPANVLDWREQVDAFEDVAAYASFLEQVTYVQDGEAVPLTVGTVTGNFFDVLGVRPVRGRSFRWEETWSPEDDVVILSHALWQSMFGGDEGVVGRRLRFGDATVEVVGVMPAGFRFPDGEVQLWTPWGWPESNRAEVSFRRAHYVVPVARLRPGVTLERANAELQTVVRRLQSDYPETNRVMGAGLAPLRDFLVREARLPLLTLLGAVVLLLVLACVNVANLALVRASERSREVAVRSALGAAQGRIVSLVATETLLIAVLAGVLGLGIGWVGVRLIERLTTLGIDGATTVELDGRVVLFTLGVTLVSALAFGLAPMIRNARSDPNEQIRQGGRGGTRGPAARRAARILIAAEIALALLITTGAGLMVRTFSQLRHVDPGFSPDQVLAVQFGVPVSRYPERDQVLTFLRRVESELEGRAGIESAGLVAQLPLNGTSWSSQFQARGWPPERVGFEILHRRADIGYFETLRIPLVRGRLFESGDRADTESVVVINETFARQHFPGEDPIGQLIAYDRAATDSSLWHRIIGIVGDQNQVSPAQPPRAEAFELFDQDWARTNWLVVRSTGDPMDALPAIREVLRDIDPLIPLTAARPLHEVWRVSVAREALVLTLLTAFAILALVLAAVGVYAVTSQTARGRSREIGIRMALGARHRDVVRTTLANGLAATTLGLGAGLAGAYAGARALDSLLFGVTARDPLTFGTVAATLLIVATVASWIPAHRASRIDPVRTLRSD